MVDKRLWLIAQENAKKHYEDENGIESWESADKYEKEDYIWWAYDNLIKNNK